MKWLDSLLQRFHYVRNLELLAADRLEAVQNDKATRVEHYKEVVQVGNELSKAKYDHKVECDRLNKSIDSKERLIREYADKVSDLNIENTVLSDNNRRLEAEVGKWEQRFLDMVNRVDTARDKHNHALELVIDWESQRLTGRQIFHHAPLLQPSAGTERIAMPSPSLRDQAKQKTEEFNAADRASRLSFFDNIVKQRRDNTPAPVETDIR